MRRAFSLYKISFTFSTVDKLYYAKGYSNYTVWINLRKEKLMLVYIYRPPVHNKQYFLENLSMIVDHYLSIYDNHIILGILNMEPSSPILISFILSLNLFNIIKSNTCFKGNGTCIELILTNRKYCFKHSSTFATGLSDHHHLVYSMLKATFKKEELKTL